MITRLDRYISSHHPQARLQSPDYKKHRLYSPQWKQMGNTMYWRLGDNPVIAARTWNPNQPSHEQFWFCAEGIDLDTLK